MEIDITKLLTNSISSIHIDGEVIIPLELLENSRIDSLKDVKIIGELSLNEDDELILTGDIQGIMVLKDDITLEPVDYSFNTYLEETLDKLTNKLDITDILWQNIMTEIPSKVRKTNEDIEISGDGWRIISEETFNEERNKANNPFQNLSELLKIKEDK